MPRRGENIWKRSDGRWEGRYIKDRDRKGKAIYGFVYGKTYAEAKQKKQLCLSELSKGKTEPKTECLFEVATQAWLQQIEEKVRESTYSKYRRLCASYICPFLGKITLDALTEEKMDKFTEYLLKSGGASENTLSPKTVLDILTVTKQILKSRKIDVNIKLPKQKKPSIRVLTRNDQLKLEEHLVGSEDPIRLGILFDLYTGLRLGELCALKWSDIDFQNASVHVRCSVSRIQDPNPAAKKRTKLILERPKTESSERDIPLPRFLLNYLLQHRGRDAAYLLTGTEKLIEPRCFSFKYKRILKSCNLEKYNFHALRHTFATRCVENGFDIKALSEILGHSDIKTTLSRYVHPSMEMKRREMDKLSVIFNSSAVFSH